MAHRGMTSPWWDRNARSPGPPRASLPVALHQRRPKEPVLHDRLSARTRRVGVLRCRAGQRPQRRARHLSRRGPPPWSASSSSTTSTKPSRIHRLSNNDAICSICSRMTKAGGIEGGLRAPGRDPGGRQRVDGVDVHVAAHVGEAWSPAGSAAGHAVGGVGCTLLVTSANPAGGRPTGQASCGCLGRIRCVTIGVRGGTNSVSRRPPRKRFAYSVVSAAWGVLGQLRNDPSLQLGAVHPSAHD